MNGLDRIIIEGLDSDRQDKVSKENEYRNYIVQHKGNVIKAHNQYFVPLLKDLKDDELKEAIKKAGINIVSHDLTKYETIEFDAYRMHFYPTAIEKENKVLMKKAEKDYEIAWEHHYRNNKHHPEYWESNGIKRDMPLEYVIEMLCDWIAMSMYYKSSFREWWESEKTQKDEATYMTDNTKKSVNYIMYELLPKISYKEDSKDE